MHCSNDASNEHLTVEQRLAQKNKEKQARLDLMQKNGELDWNSFNVKSENFKLIFPDNHREFASVNVIQEATLGDIFRRFMSVEFVTKVWDYWPADMWVYGSSTKTSTINKGQPDLKAIYTMLAVYIRICALQNAPKENDPHKRPLRDAITEAMQAFQQRTPNYHFHGMTIIETLLSRFHIPRELYKDLGAQFQSVIEHCGRVIAGDEKLLHFTGDSAFIRQIITKPDKIGFWFYEAVCLLGPKVPYMLLTRVQDTCANLDEHIPCDEILKEWGTIAKKYATNNRNCGPVLVFDSYYTVNAG